MNDQELANAFAESMATIYRINQNAYGMNPQARYVASWNRAVQRYAAWVDANEPILKRTHLAAWNDILQAEGLAQSKDLPYPLPSLWRRIFGP